MAIMLLFGDLPTTYYYYLSNWYTTAYGRNSRSNLEIVVTRSNTAIEAGTIGAAA